LAQSLSVLRTPRSGSSFDPVLGYWLGPSVNGALLVSEVFLFSAHCKDSLAAWAGEWRWQSCRSLQSCSSSCPAWADWVRRGRRCELMNQGRLCAPTTSLTVRQSRVGATTKVGGTGREEGWPASQGFRSSNPPLCPGKSRRVSPAESTCETLR